MTDQKKTEAVSEAKKPAAKRKKAPIVIGTVVVVLVIACAGFFVWHEQPSFCNAICHTPMDGYLTTYEATPGQASTDKWGNEVSDASAMLAPVHAKVANVTCMGCHVPTLSEQVSEGLGWISGNYSVVQTKDLRFVPEEKKLSQLTSARGVASEEFCLKSGCHANSDGSAMTRDDLAQKTSNMTRNVHTQPHGSVECSDCHKAHRASTNYCNKCHTDATTPTGWVDYKTSQSQEPVAVSE